MSEADEKLVFAVMANDIDLVRKRLSAVTDIDFQYRNKGAALHQAAHRGYLEIARLLIANGADVDLVHQEWQQRPIELAIENRHRDIVELLRQRGAIDASPPIDESPPARPAADAGRLDVGYAFKLDAYRADTVAIEVEEPLLFFFSACAVHCDPGCCGLYAFSFAPEVVRDAAGRAGYADVVAGLSLLRDVEAGGSTSAVTLDCLNAFLDRADFIGFLEYLIALLGDGHDHAAAGP